MRASELHYSMQFDYTTLIYQHTTPFPICTTAITIIFYFILVCVCVCTRVCVRLFYGQKNQGYKLFLSTFVPRKFAGVTRQLNCEGNLIAHNNVLTWGMGPCLGHLGSNPPLVK